MNNITEEWKGAKYCLDTGEIEDWSHIVEVSNLGNVRYTEEYKASHKQIKDSPRVVYAGNTHSEYKYVRFYFKGKPKQRRMHRLVLSTFNPIHRNKKKKMDADHIDFDHTNNKLYNLRWMERGKHSSRKRTNCTDYVFA